LALNPRKPPTTRGVAAVLFALFLAACATPQKKPVNPIQPPAQPKLTKALALSQEISALLDRLAGGESQGHPAKETPASIEALLARYLELSPGEQTDPQLQGSIERLLDVSRAMALETNRAPEPVTEEEGEPAPDDELLEVTTFLSPEELRSTFEAVSKAKEKIDLGIQIPLDNPEVLGYVNLYQTKLRKWFTAALERGGPYIPEMKVIFKDEGVPPELVYLGIVESAFKTNAKSRAKALGMWQFMEGTAKNYGLTCDFWQDERLDPWESARGSAKYLRTLHEMFNDWNFALASYNCGEGKVIRYLRNNPKGDYWAMRKSRYLRRETKEYVPAILAAILLASDPSAFGLETAPPTPKEQTASIPVNEPLDLRVLARHLQVPVEILLSLNPSLKRILTPPRPYDLKVPAGLYETADLFLSGADRGGRPDYVVHSVRKGETIKTIAKRYRSDPVEIQDINLGMSGRLRPRTQILVFPGAGAYATNAPREPKPPAAEQERPARKASGASEPSQGDVHVVRKGDTLAKIAREHGTTVGELCRLNHLTQKTTLHIGQKIRIP